MVRIRIRVTGRVQGVGFRYHTRTQAEKIGVSGWVRNQADGGVEAEFEGSEDAVEAMLSWCHEGPIMARVDHVDVVSRESGVEPKGKRFVVKS